MAASMQEMSAVMNQELERFTGQALRLREMLAAVRQGNGGAETSDRLGQLLLELKQTLRAMQLLSLKSGQLVSGAKERADGLHLAYQSALYEQRFLRREIQTLRAFRSAHPEIPLVPAAEFLAGLEPAQAQAYAPVPGETPAEAARRAHRLQLARLAHELELRRDRLAQIQALKARRDALQQAESRRRAEALRLKADLVDLVQRARPLQQRLLPAGCAELPEPSSGSGGGPGFPQLPAPLHALFSSARVFQTIAEATAGASGNTGFPRLARVELQGLPPAVQPPAGADSGLASLLRPFPLRVVLSLAMPALPGTGAAAGKTGDSEETLQLAFAYLPGLQTILVDVHGSSLSLACLYPGDAGLVLPVDPALLLGTTRPSNGPHPHSPNNPHSSSFRAAVASLGLGQPYRWAQELCGLRTVPPAAAHVGAPASSPSLSAVDEAADLEPTADRGLLEFLERLRARRAAAASLQRILDGLQALAASTSSAPSSSSSSSSSASAAGVPAPEIRFGEDPQAPTVKLFPDSQPVPPSGGGGSVRLVAWSELRAGPGPELAARLHQLEAAASSASGVDRPTEAGELPSSAVSPPKHRPIHGYGNSLPEWASAGALFFQGTFAVTGAAGSSSTSAGSSSSASRWGPSLGFEVAVPAEYPARAPVFWLRLHTPGGGRGNNNSIRAAAADDPLACSLLRLADPEALEMVGRAAAPAFPASSPMTKQLRPQGQSQAQHAAAERAILWELERLPLAPELLVALETDAGQAQLQTSFSLLGLQLRRLQACFEAWLEAVGLAGAQQQHQSASGSQGDVYGDDEDVWERRLAPRARGACGPELQRRLAAFLAGFGAHDADSGNGSISSAPGADSDNRMEVDDGE